MNENNLQNKIIQASKSDDYMKQLNLILNEERDKLRNSENWEFIKDVRAEKAKSKKYEAYMNSAAWKLLKTIRHFIDKNKCTKCNNDKQLQLHHTNYDRIFCEMLEDVITKCKYCHKEGHEVQNEIYKLDLKNVKNDKSDLKNDLGLVTIEPSTSKITNFTLRNENMSETNEMNEMSRNMIKSLILQTKDTMKINIDTMVDWLEVTDGYYHDQSFDQKNLFDKADEVIAKKMNVKKGFVSSTRTKSGLIKSAKGQSFSIVNPLDIIKQFKDHPNKKEYYKKYILSKIDEINEEAASIMLNSKVKAETKKAETKKAETKKVSTPTIAKSDDQKTEIDKVIKDLGMDIDLNKVKCFIIMK
jgi:hypothetical protein